MPGGRTVQHATTAANGPGPHGRFAKISSACYLPAPVCEVVSLVAFALFVAVCSVGATCVPAPVLMPLGLVLFAVTLAQELSYCEGAPAALYAVPPLPPLGLFMPGSLCVEPGDVAELPGVSWAAFALGGLPNPHMLLGPPLLAYAGAAPITAMATMQLAENSLCLMFRSPFPGAHHSALWVLRLAVSTSPGFWTCAY